MSPKKTPLPTDVRPTMNPPKTPISSAATRSRFVRSQSPSPAGAVCTSDFATRPDAAEQERGAEHLRHDVLDPVAVAVVSFVAIQTPTSDIGAEPISIQPASLARTLPMRRCCTALTVLNAAPWAMSVPIAVVGGTPKRKTSSGVMSDPHPSRSSPPAAR